MTLATTTPEEEKRVALLRAVGFDRLNDAQRELALAIANRYDLDPMLKHLVMISGRPYITRDGLLHVAHKSGQLDGIETTEPVLGDDGYWRSSASVFRKDMSRAFTYTGRYPAKGGGNAAYAPEMAVKVGEVMALRRAFDIAAPTAEERWDEEQTTAPSAPPPPTSLTARISERASSIAPTVVDTATLAGVDQPEITDQAPTDAPDVPGETEVVEGVVVEDEQTAAVPSEPAGITLEEFSAAVPPESRGRAKALAKLLYPTITRFGDLKGHELEAILDGLEKEQEDNSTEYKPTETTTEPLPATIPADPPPSVDNGGIVVCGDVSPLSGNTCTLDAGHTPKTHRAGLRESW